MGTGKAPGTGLVLLLVLAPSLAMAQLSAPPRAPAEFVNAVAAGISYGEKTNSDADFLGWSLDYGRSINRAWVAGLSLTWDEETERFADRPDNVVRSYNLIGTISYNLSPHFALSTGLAAEFANDDNASQSMSFKSGDLATGISLGYTVPISARNSLGASLAWEYNLSQNQPSVSLDLSLGWGF